MGWLIRNTIGRVAPATALKMELRSRALRAYYEAGQPARHHKPRTDKRSGNAQTERAAEPIRSSARHLDENFDIASGILDILVARSIGRGIQPEPQVMMRDGSPATTVNQKLLKLWDQWIYSCDVTGQFHYYPLQRIKARSWFRDGEVFTQRIIGNVPGLQHGTVLPYSLEALEADYCPNDLSDQEKRIVQGIEVNAWGRPLAYHFYKSHPGDSYFGYSPNNTKRVPAERIQHLSFKKRLHQLRGISVFATVINRLDDIKEVDENERIAARVAAAMAAFIKKGSPDSYEASQEVDEHGQPKRRDMTFEPGIIFDELQEGEEIGTINTTRPNNALIPFRDAQLRAAAGGTMVSFSSASKNYNGTYSAQRQELVEQEALYQMLGSEFVYRDAQPIWDGFIDAVRLSGAVDIPRGIDLDTLYDCTHTGPSMIWIDPKKETDSLVLQMKWGLKARSRIIRERGDNPDQTNREIQRDQQELERMGIKLIGDGDTTSETAPAEETTTQE